jgi:Flp pilus assembly pilin Flp
MRIPSINVRAVAVGHGDQGATSVEYALIASLIALVVIVGVALLGANVLGLYSESATSFADAT